MPLRRLPRIVGFEVPPLKKRGGGCARSPIVGLLNVEPSREWLDAFIGEAENTRGSLTNALVTVEGGRVLFFASAGDAQTRCTAVPAMIGDVSKSVMTRTSRKQGVAPQAAQASRPRSVLVAEDNEVLLDVACDALRAAGWSAFPASGVAQATALLECQAMDAGPTDIDLLIQTEGVGLASDIRAPWPQIGVVVTGRHADDTLALPEGALFLAKPYQRRQLLAMLDMAIDSSRNGR
ncbi:response regulator [Luteibacter aegosomatissinici]|uniref:response regulator n=1 Tax=Luteibacter aegosomatissinici TaxID=2911539 RepID=UPI001FFA621F|nr:response regulator [Luteibacter aegosomatissinici]UPG92779.1 response regulator [Luteibacter aegosomatissinici]